MPTYTIDLSILEYQWPFRSPGREVSEGAFNLLQLTMERRAVRAHKQVAVMTNPTSYNRDITKPSLSVLHSIVDNNLNHIRSTGLEGSKPWLVLDTNTSSLPHKKHGNYHIW